MRSIAIINQKGGAGKTTTAVNVAAALARGGVRVLLVDLDPQSHASLHLGVQLGRAEPGMYEVLVDGLPAAKVLREVAQRLTLLPASIDLVAAELELLDRPQRERRLAAALASCPDSFDFCLVDCPPSLGVLTINALAAVGEVVIPLQPHFLALQGLGRLLETITLVRQELNPRLRVSGIVMCMYERGTRLAQEVLDDVTQFIRAARPDEAWFQANVFATRVRRNIKLAECPSFGQAVFDYAPGSHGAEDYQALAAEILRAETSATAPPPAAGAPHEPLAARATAPVSVPAAELVMPGAAVAATPALAAAERGPSAPLRPSEDAERA